MSDWCVLVTCNDCTGYDPMGCNDGEPWLMTDASGAAIRYATESEARAAAEAAQDAGSAPWTYTAAPCGLGSPAERAERAEREG